MKRRTILKLIFTIPLCMSISNSHQLYQVKRGWILKNEDI